MPAPTPSFRENPLLGRSHSSTNLYRNGRNAGGSFSSSGITPIPGVGTVFPEVHVTAAWGVLQAAQVLRPDDRSNITVPAPASAQGSTLEGEGWTLKIATGWVVRAGNRPGDLQLVRDVPRQ